ncbi:MAG: serine/threonine-protein kinase [Pseudonocardiaceae bacterium]
MRAGQLIAGRYRLEEQVGTGGMGVVWRALDKDLDRVVALKRGVRGADVGSERTHRRMRREAQIAAGLHHPHVVAFIDEVTDGHERWLVMEYVPSQSLAQLLDEAGPLLPRHVTHVGAQIASALEAVHARGVVHRDVKPGNILITEDGTAKLTDFGISRPICGDVTVTDSGVIGGTVAFLSPEVADGAEPTPASDVFALGATLFAAVEGMPPFGTSDNPLLVLRRAAAGDLLPVRRAGPLTPVLSALLQPDPAKRPDAAGARQLLQDLANTLAGDEGPLRWSVGTANQRRRFRRLTLILAACGATLAIIAGLLIFRLDGSRPVGTPAILGDPRTADPCALIDPATLDQFGATTRKTAYGNFNRCDVIVKSDTGTEVIVKVDLDKPAAPVGENDKMGPLRVFPQPRNGNHCDRVVLLSDQNRVSITSTVQPGPDTAELCAMSDAATDHVLTVLRDGSVPRRPAPFDPVSLARVDACDLLDSGSVAGVLGAGAGGPKAGFGDWECRWNSSVNGLDVHLYFDRNVPLDASDGVPATLSDHESYITARADGPDCAARVVNRKDFDANGDPVDELLVIAVSGPRPVDQLCGPARELAAVAAATLPPR